jgi:hypothetical protein
MLRYTTVDDETSEEPSAHFSLYDIPGFLPPIRLLFGGIGFGQISHEPKYSGGRLTFEGYDALDVVPGNHQLQPGNVNGADPDSGAMSRFNQPASHRKAPGRLCRPNVFIQFTLGGQENARLSEKLNHPCGLQELWSHPNEYMPSHFSHLHSSRYNIPFQLRMGLGAGEIICSVSASRILPGARERPPEVVVGNTCGPVYLVFAIVQNGCQV